MNPILQPIKEIIEKNFCVNLLEKSQHRHQANSTKAYCYLAHKLTNQSLTDIGKSINKDHSTVIFHARNENYGAEVIARFDKSFKYLLEKCEDELLEYKIYAKKCSTID